MKTCTKCKKTKDLTEFYKNKTSKDGYGNYCRICKGLYQLEYRQNNKEKVALAAMVKREENIEKSKNWNKNNLDKHRNNRLKSKYGIGTEDYNRMVEQQNNLCAICKKPETTKNSKNNEIKILSIDHSHITGQIRGLLCVRCNMGIGYLSLDNGVELLLSAIEYYNKHNQ